MSSLEVEHGKRLAEGLVKQLTGGDTISARFLHQEFFEFRPQMKLWLAANHAPRVQSDDEAMWRRIVRIPFEHVIPEEQRDLGLKSRLRTSNGAHRAILAWLVKGCLAWRKERLSVPPVVKQATDAYRNEMDPLQEFYADRCTLDPDAIALSSVLWSEYQSWAKDGGERWPLTRKRFGEALKAHGLEDVKHRGQRAWRGIQLAGPPRREETGSVGGSDGRGPEQPGRTHGTDRDASSDIVPLRVPPREEDFGNRVLSRPASTLTLPTLGEWDQVMNPRLAAEPACRGVEAESTATPSDRSEKPETGLEALSGGEEPGAGGGGALQ